MRQEQEIFDDLARLCVSPGYAHAIACLCFKHNMVFYREKMTADDMRPLYSPDRLIRTEISTLIGLLVKEDIDYTFPDPSVFQQYLDKTETLLKELHVSMSATADREPGTKSTSENIFKQFGTGEMLRALIFYEGESAYSFQYRDLTPRKYARDNRWLEATKGFSIERVRDVANAVQKIQDEKVTKIRTIHSDKWPLLILAGYIFTVREVADRTNMDASAVGKILTAFTVSPKDHTTFQAINDFNVTNATPLIRYNDDSFILFQQFSLVVAIYESPIYWMRKDRQYKDIAAQNRGRFTEEFCRERLESVFGKENVYSNVNIFGARGREPGEIDVLVLFGDRAIVLQAKSKQLTLEARKGNDGQIKEDFKKSVQNSYNQGYRDAKFLIDEGYRFKDSESNEILISHEIKEIYILCVVSDHYPALSFQARAFLQSERTDVIHPPFVMDVFTLDAMTEMLQSPLWLLSYINRRVNYSDQLLAPNELVILSYHIKNNLWRKDEHHLEYFHDDISADLEAAMTVRRENFPGDRTPPGFLARFETTDLGRIIKMLDENPTPATLDLGFTLLSQDEADAVNMVKNIENFFNLSKKKGASVHIDTQAQSFLKSYRRGDAIVSRARNKTGRNAPCPCGSGRKYKKCCLSR